MIELRWLVDPRSDAHRVLQYRVWPKEFICVDETYEEFERQLPAWRDVPEVSASSAAVERQEEQK